MELHVHYLCPYAQRALYVKAFKRIDCQVIEQDLSVKSESLYAVNPLGKVPALKIFEGEDIFNLYESFQVCEFLDSFPGPSLYLRTCQNFDPLCKALIDQKIKGDIDSFVSAFVPFWWKTPTAQDKTRAQNMIQQINKRLENGKFFMHEEFGDVVTMVDIMLYPFIERVWALRESFLSEMTTGLDLSNTWKWFERMSGFEWIQQYRAPEHRLRKVIRNIKENRYSGLALPVTVYDE